MGISMKRRVLRLALGLGYVILVTLLLLIQAGAGVGTGDRWIVLGEILLLGIPLAIVLILYIRLTNQIEQHNGKVSDVAVENVSEGFTGDNAVVSAESGGRNIAESIQAGCIVQASLSYEEQYARFLTVIQRTDRELSERELEVAWLLYRGYTNRQIGEELFIAETTVKKHVSHIYEKLGVTGRKEFKAMIYSDPGGEKFSQ